jgi:hypothetical protein
LLERALRIDEAVYGPDHPTVAMQLDDLAVVLEHLGEFPKAQLLMARAARIRSGRSSSSYVTDDRSQP